MLDYDQEMWIKRQIPETKRKLKCSDEEARERLLNELEEINKLKELEGSNELYD